MCWWMNLASYGLKYKENNIFGFESSTTAQFMRIFAYGLEWLNEYLKENRGEEK
jgi:hypothetical protein